MSRIITAMPLTLKDANVTLKHLFSTIVQWAVEAVGLLNETPN